MLHLGTACHFRRSLRCGSALEVFKATTQMQERFWGAEKCSKQAHRNRNILNNNVFHKLLDNLEVSRWSNARILEELCHCKRLLLFLVCFPLDFHHDRNVRSSNICIKHSYNFPRLVFHRFVANLKIKKSTHWRGGSLSRKSKE